MISKKNFPKINVIIGLLVLILSTAVFFYTAQSSVAFWDCGEYAGASSILGVPHPPGNPLFVIIGRVAIMSLSFIDDVAYRLNLFNAFASGLAVMLVYLSSVKVITLIKEELSDYERLVAVAGAFGGALFLAFSSTWWFNSVESEVYGLSMLFMLLETWFVLKWYEYKDSAYGDRFLYAMIYFAVLGMGIHMYTMLILPPIALFYFYVRREDIKDIKLLAIIFIIGFGIISPKPFIWGLALVLVFLPFVVMGKSIIAKLGAAIIAIAPISLFVFGIIPYEGDLANSGMWMVTIAALFVIGGTPFFSKKIEYEKWKMLFAFATLAVVGYSVQAFIPIRAASPDLTINENAAKDWDTFKNFLERKQYGDESMFHKMFFNRQGTLLNQFGAHARMGFGGFFVNQYGKIGTTFGDKKLPILFIIPGLLGFLGLFAFYRKDKGLWMFVSSLFLISSVGLVLYMNFSDGTKGLRLEVRDRDYFWTPGFMYFSTLIALGFFYLLSEIKNNTMLKSLNKSQASIVSYALITIIVLAPFGTLAANWDTHNRHNNYFPHDYAYNLLNSCKKGGILFTNGDNDTFPLWYLQEAEGVRKDVIVANLSLLNTPWYIKQLVKKGLPTSYTSDEINKIRPQRGFGKDVKVPLANAKIDVKIKKNEHPYLKVQDIMVLNIVDANKWKRPIYFAITVGQSNYMGLYEYMKMEGMVYNVTNKKVVKKVNRDRTIDLLDSVYHYRGLEKNSDVHLMGEDAKLITNYGALFIMLAQDYLQEYYQNKNDIAVLKRNLEDSSVVASYEPEVLKARQSNYKELTAKNTEIEKTVLAIMKSGQKSIGKTDFVFDYYIRYLEEFGLKDSVKNLVTKRVFTSEKPDVKTYLKYFELLSQGKVDSTLNNDSIMRVATNFYKNDGSINILAGEYFEKKDNFNAAKAYYSRAVRSKDKRINGMAVQRLNSLNKK